MWEHWREHVGNHSVASTSLRTGTDLGFVMLVLSWLLRQHQDREKAGRTDTASCSFSLEAGVGGQLSYGLCLNMTCLDINMYMCVWAYVMWMGTYRQTYLYSCGDKIQGRSSQEEVLIIGPEKSGQEALICFLRFKVFTATEHQIGISVFRMSTLSQRGEKTGQEEVHSRDSAGSEYCSY